MASDILLPVTGILGLVGLWFARMLGQAGQGGTLDGIITPSMPSPDAQKPLPTNISLSAEVVHNLAHRIILTHGFLCSPRELVATAYIESYFRPWVYRNEKRIDGSIWDTSYGLMQTLLGTAKDMYARGYRGAGVPTKEMLLKPEVSMYFGAAYKDWLLRTYKGRTAEWYVRAYNGGPGWEKTQAGPGNTAVYYRRYTSAIRTLYGAV
jgi:hypothetical protein